MELQIERLQKFNSEHESTQYTMVVQSILTKVACLKRNRDRTSRNYPLPEGVFIISDCILQFQTMVRTSRINAS